MKNKMTKRLLAASMALVFVLTSAVMTPRVASAAAKKTVTVKTQKQLDAALKDKSVTSIVIKTSKNVSLKIKDGDYSNKTLTVASPKATINNYGDFKKISVNDGKTFTDRGVGNNIVVKDTNSLKLVTGKQSMGAKITVTANNAKLSIVNNGEVDTINVKSTASVSVKGAAKEAPTITANATGAKIVAAQDANIVLNKPATLTVQSGAELGTLTVNANADVKVAQGSSVAKLAVAKNASEVNLVADGSIGSVTVDAKASVSVSGETTATVAITSNVEGASISSSVKTDVTLNAEAKVSLDKGAEGSNIKAGNANVKPVVNNKTDSSVTVTDSDGSNATVGAGETGSGTPVKDANKDTTTPSGSNNTGNSGSISGGGSSSNNSSNSSGGNNGQSGSSNQNVLRIVVFDDPINDTNEVTTGNVVVGSILRAEANYAPNFNDKKIKWYVDGVVVAANCDYTVTANDIGKVIVVEMSVLDASGKVMASASSDLGTVKAGPISGNNPPTLTIQDANNSNATVVAGNVQVGMKLHIDYVFHDNEDITNARYTHVWDVGGTVTTSPEYVVHQGDIGKTISVTATASGSNFSATVKIDLGTVKAGYIPPTLTIQDANNSNATVDYANVKPGMKLHIYYVFHNNEDITNVTYTHVWNVGGQSTTGNDYVVKDADMGKTISVTATAVGSDFSSTETIDLGKVKQRPTLTIQDASNSYATVSYGGVKPGMTLHIDYVFHDNEDETTAIYTHVWNVGGQSTTGNDYVVHQGDIGKTISVTATASGSNFSATEIIDLGPVGP